jgi:hypothetical protein
MSLNVSPTTAIEHAVSALVEAAKAVEGDAKAQQAELNVTLVQGGFVERILGESLPAVAAAPAQAAIEHIDKSAETANMQTFARPHAPNPEPQRQADTALPTDKHGRSEFAIPAALLVPTTLVGLQVQHAASWPMSARGFDPDLSPLHEARVHDREPAPYPVEEEPQEEPEETIAPEPVAEEEHDTSCGVVFADDEGAWCEALTRALRVALAAKVPPRALLVAAEQWQRGRCVVLACPQGLDPAGAAWAFVLWPRPRAGRASGAASPLALFGLRIEARLQWSALPTGAKWCHVRVIKQHHPSTGRQLIPSAPDPSPRVACEVQLGPVLARPLRCCDVCLRINAVRRFWNALGTQWSMQVVVSSHPLLEDDVVKDVR